MTAEAPVRVMRIITRLHISGPALQALLLTGRLSQDGYDSLLVAGDPLPAAGEDDNMLHLADQHDVSVIMVPELARSMNPVRALRAFWRLYQLIRTHQPDVVHTHTTTAGFLGRLAARLAGVPVVVHTLHWHPFHGYYSATQTQFFIWLERLGAYFADSIITLSESLRRELVETYHITRKSRMIVLPIGLDLAAFAAVKRGCGDFRARCELPEGVPLVGIVGRLIPVKNHGLFLRAALRVRERFPDAHFVIVGDGLSRSSIDHQIEALGLGRAVTVTGWQQDMASVYSDLDLLVLSSLNEGTPLPLIEALAAGCPVVATAVGGVSDLLDGGQLGALVPSNDVDALTAAMITALESPPDPEKARTAMLDRYSIDRLVTDMEGLYRGLLAKKRQR